MIDVRTALIAPLLAAAPISANAACWPAEHADAATIRDFQSMLMVTALRCAVTKVDISADYNAFVVAEREQLESANLRLKMHFRAEAGPVGGQVAYDRFTTSLANAYGAGSSTPEDCARGAALARQAAAATRAALLRIAQDALFGRPVVACETPVPTSGDAPALALAPLPETPVALALTEAPPAAAPPPSPVDAAPPAGDIGTGAPQEAPRAVAVAAAAPIGPP